MNTGEYNNFSRSNGMVSNMSSSSLDDDEEENPYGLDFKRYIDEDNPRTTQINLLTLINNFVQETGFRIQNAYILTPAQLQQYQLQQYNFAEDLIAAYGYAQGTQQYGDLVTKLQLFHRGLMMFNDFLYGIDYNIGLIGQARNRGYQELPFIQRMYYIEYDFDNIFEEEPLNADNYAIPYVPGVETHTIPNSEFTDIDFRYCEYVAVKYFFLPEGNISTQHPNIIKYQMNIIESMIHDILIRNQYVYSDEERYFLRDIKHIQGYRLTYPHPFDKENVDISYFYEYIQLYALMAMYRYLVTYNGVHIERKIFLNYMYQIEALLYTDNNQLQKVMVLNYINFFKLQYLQQNPNN